MIRSILVIASAAVLMAAAPSSSELEAAYRYPSPSSMRAAETAAKVWFSRSIPHPEAAVYLFDKPVLAVIGASTTGQRFGPAGFMCGMVTTQDESGHHVGAKMFVVVLLGDQILRGDIEDKSKTFVRPLCTEAYRDHIGD